MSVPVEPYSEDWANLPDPILTQVFSYLSVADRCRSGATCKHWQHCLQTPQLWRNFTCGFYLPADGKLLKCIQQYGQFVSVLTVYLNQREPENRANAISLLDHISHLDNIRLSHLTVAFKGENQLFYGGHEFVYALTNLVTKMGEKTETSKLMYLNLSGLQANFSDDFINCVATNCLNLEYLNILNKVLVGGVSPRCITNLVQKCKKIKVLYVYHSSLTDDVLMAFCEAGRTPLVRLGVVCRRLEKYTEDLSSDAWSSLVRANPGLTVELGFDDTCPLYRVGEIMKPEIPVAELSLATFTMIDSEVNSAVTYYKHFLEKLLIQTRPSKELQEALLNVARQCKKLKALFVYCVLDKDTVDQILNLCPTLRKSGNYILKWTMEPEPWTVGREEEADSCRTMMD